ncbi:ABC transporter ATP-binding protein [Lutibacter sp. A64]|uniref:ABC transporter ATP-binding protein n=1 Tax=Lutibacter sp. A64 TaxID=2918526 RepID=UPI001F055191|nr:ABC transporter ATP-binding protein [Lutibacter sp. A64]UMB53093.1 ABC transporter ATP-binding protein [Lutibacter sp. A64]
MLKVTDISFGYTSKEVLKNVSFTASKGDYIAIIGESGCGKSTLLEIIYGLLHIEKGAVYWNEEKLLGPNFYLIPGEDFMKYLPQDFDLMPYITVEENIGKNISSLDPNKLNRIKELLEVVDMSNFLNTKVKNLSGGQKQRVAIAKVLADEPEVLLLDEPFSHIDNFRKNNLRRSIFRYLKSKNILCIVATHDTTDALSFADEILVIRDGKLVAKNTPETLYNNPESKYVASFFNEINEIPLHIIEAKNTSKETVLLYPNQLKVVEKSELKATVIASYFKGSYYLIEADLKNETIFFEHPTKLEINQKVDIEVNKN